MESTLCCSEESFILFKYIGLVINYIIYDIFGLLPLDHLARFLRFFSLNIIKTSIIISSMIYIISILRAGINPTTVLQFLKNRPKWFAYLIGALLGVITPFCSCSAVPIFLVFVASKIPIGVTISFLVSAPIVTEAGIVLIADAFGINIAIMTILIAIVIGIVAGYIFEVLSNMGAKLLIIGELNEPNIPKNNEKLSIKARHSFAIFEVKKIFKSIWIWLIISILIASILNIYLSPTIVSSYLSPNNWWSTIITVIIGVPIYGTSGTVVPIAYILFSKGAAIGTVLAFILSVNGASIPALILLKPVFTIKGMILLITIFITSFTLVGLILNLI